MRRRAGLAVVLLLAACTGGGEPEAPVVADAVSGEGAPIADGFEVVAGTVLLGPPMPAVSSHYHEGEPVPDEGWVAVLALEGDPHEATEAYVRQAEALGLERHGPPPEDGRTGCHQPGRGPHTCVALATSPNRSGEPTRTLIAHAVRGTSDNYSAEGDVAGAPYSALYLRYSTSDLYVPYWAYVVPDRRRSDPPPARWAEPPGTGERFGDGWPQQHLLRVAEGSELIGPMALHVDCSLGGSYAVLRVTGDPDEVLADYADQLEEINRFATDEPLVDTATSAGRVRAVYTEQAGGDSYQLRLLTPPEGPSWLHVRSCAG